MASKKKCSNSGKRAEIIRNLVFYSQKGMERDVFSIREIYLTENKLPEKNIGRMFKGMTKSEFEFNDELKVVHYMRIMLAVKKFRNFCLHFA